MKDSFTNNNDNEPTNQTVTTSILSPSLAQAMEVLHPSRYYNNHSITSSLTEVDPISNITGSRSTKARSTTTKTTTSRFSSLLLEHKERELQDWAVIASSSCMKPKQQYQSSHSLQSFSSSKEEIPLYSSNRDVSTSTSTRKMTNQSAFYSNSTDANYSHKTKKIKHPSTFMKSIHGRIHLCSKSIVFEPEDIARGIIRCPLDKLDCPPFISKRTSNSSTTSSTASTSTISTTPLNCNFYESSQEVIESSSNTTTSTSVNGQNSNSMVVVIQCRKYYIMKENNIIEPYETITQGIKFKFIFMHSNPNDFIALSKKLYTMIHDPNPTKPFSTSLNEMIQPMLQKPFDPTNFFNVWETPRTNNLRSFLLGPLLAKPGCSIVTDTCIYFQPLNGILEKSIHASKAYGWYIENIVGVARRYNGLKDCAVELYFRSGPSVLLSFESCRDRELVMKIIVSSSTNIPCYTDREFVEEAFWAWKNGYMDNFHYLLILNSAAGRSFHDLSRYPVFPWVLSDYSSSKLDLSNCEEKSSIDYELSSGNDATTIGSDSREEKMLHTFRDLTKPIGALNEERLQNFQERLKGMQDDMEHAFLYGTHYSAPGYVLYFLVRMMPEHMLCLQNGKYDAPDRLFHSLYHCYSSLLINPADVKECIPQFFDPKSGVDLLLNSSKLQLGVMQNGELVNDVQLPNWASSPKDFLKKNRQALESDYCSRKLPRWIDLVFGEKSRGDKALEAMNLFHPMSYLSPHDLERMNLDDRYQAELHATEFGIVPDMLFCRPHPLKDDHEGCIESFVVADDERRMCMIDENEGDHNRLRKEEDGLWEVLGSSRTNKTTTKTTPMTSSKSVGFGAGMYLSPNRMNHGALKSFSSKESIDDLNSQNRTSNRSSSVWASENSSEQVEDMDVKSNSGNKIKNINNEKFHIVSDTSSLERSGSHERIANLSYSGSGIGDSSTANISLKKSGTFGVDTGYRKHSGDPYTEPLTPLYERNQESTQHGWEMKPIITPNQIHGDTVSGCFLSTGENSLLTTISLDGSLMVHSVPESRNEQKSKRRGFSSASSLGRFSNLGSKSSNTNVQKLHLFRSHSSADPLASLVVLKDERGGHIAFAGGHDDVVLAYGINSACALASVYSHRDAVTGIDILPNPVGGKSRCTHIMVSGSWDATVKLWSVSISEGETVSIDREPLAEFYDADTSITSVTAVNIGYDELAISAGCGDGSVVIWTWNFKNGTKQLLHKEESRKGYGPCNVVKASESSFDDIMLFAGYDNGRIISFAFKNGNILPIAKLHIGSPVRCLFVHGTNIFAGCADGGLRLVPVGIGGHFDYNPSLWRDVNGKNSPCLTSLHVVVASSFLSSLSDANGSKYVCVTGGEDGSISLFSLSYSEGSD